jgi:hypothetical protein
MAENLRNPFEMRKPERSRPDLGTRDVEGNDFKWGFASEGWLSACG